MTEADETTNGDPNGRMTMFPDTLKTVPIEKIELALAKALAELTGEKIDCNIATVEYGASALTKCSARMTLTVAVPLLEVDADGSLKIPF